MVSAKDLRFYGLVTIDDYFELIANSYLKGQTNKAENLIALLTKKQKIAALKFYLIQQLQREPKDRSAFELSFYSVADYLEGTKEKIEEESRLQLKMVSLYSS